MGALKVVNLLVLDGKPITLAFASLLELLERKQNQARDKKNCFTRNRDTEVPLTRASLPPTVMGTR